MKGNKKIDPETRKDFKIESEKSVEFFNIINKLFTNACLLTASLGQSVYNCHEDNQGDIPSGYPYDPQFTRKIFESNPRTFLTTGRNTMFSLTVAEILALPHGSQWIGNWTAEQRTNHDMLHKFLGNGVGLIIPEYADIILSPYSRIPMIYFKERTNILYDYDMLPSLLDPDNIIVIEETVYERVVHQFSKPDGENPPNLSVGYRVGNVGNEFAKVIQSKDKTNLYAKGNKEQVGHKVTVKLYRPGAHPQPAHLTPEYYKGLSKKGRLIVIFPYLIAQMDVLGATQFGAEDKEKPDILFSMCK